MQIEAGYLFQYLGCPAWRHVHLNVERVSNCGETGKPEVVAKRSATRSAGGAGHFLPIQAGVWFKIFKCVEGSRSSMMGVEDEHNHMGAAFGPRYRFGQPGTPAAE
jgi:hypothetical protein